MVWGYCFAIVFQNIPIILYPPCRSGKWYFQVTFVITITHKINNLPLYYLLNHHSVHCKFWILYNTFFWYIFMIYYHNGWCNWNLGKILFWCTSTYQFYLGGIHKFIPEYIYRWGFTISNPESRYRPDQDVIFPYPYSGTITI